MKKNLLKIVSLMAAGVLAISTLASCGAKTEESEGEASNEEKKVLTVATNAEFPPFEYLEGEEMVGSDIDMIKAIGEKMGYEVEITNIDFDAALTGAATGKYDVAVSGVTATDERRKSMNFSDDYYKASQAIIVMADGDIKSKDDIEGKAIGCQEGTTGEQYLLDNGYNVQSFKTGSEAVSALKAAKLDAVVIDDAVAKALSAEQEGATAVLDEALTQEAYAIVLQLGNDELTAKINEALKAIKDDGTLAKIYEKYELPFDAE